MEEATGPIDYLVLQIPSTGGDGSIAAALLDLVDTATVSILDLMVIQKDVDGAVSGLEVDAIDGELRVFAGACSGVLSEDDRNEAALALDPGTTAVVLLYENTWARPFVAAARAAGADVVASARIPADVLMEALDALD